MKIKCTSCKGTYDFNLKFPDIDPYIWVVCKKCKAIMIKVPYDSDFVDMTKLEQLPQ